ncbi:lipase family protein [Limnobacter sp.]|uniref:lipase family protein n=1 Tax=Limnobacter sp. TaxID=2003368 RepID=UPI002FE2F907
MMILSPFEVYFLAASVYQIRVQSQPAMQRLYEKRSNVQFPGIKAPFDPVTLNAFKGRTGVRFTPQSLQFLTASTGFGFLARQQSLGASEYVLVTRGTDIAPDWLSNLNVGVAMGPSSKLVHAGFNDTFNSYRTQLDTLLRQVGPPPAVIHCVGHSLGGALANLNAALLHERGYRVCLYTLGAPRVGHYPFAQDLESKLKGRVYRVANRFDPVAMIPVFPYCHAAVKDDTYITHAGGNLINFEAHSTDPNKPGYAVPMNHPNKTWADIKQPMVRVGAFNETLDDSIKILGAGLLFSGQLLVLIGQAIYKLCSKISQTALLTTQRFFDGCAEAMDRLAEMLMVCATQSFILKEEAKAVVGAIMKFLGRGGSVVADQLTVAVVRWALSQLTTELRAKATLAITRRY